MDKQQRGIQVIRIWLGVTMLIHGVMKVTSLEDTLAFFASIGLPSLFFYQKGQKRSIYLLTFTDQWSIINL